MSNLSLPKNAVWRKQWWWIERRGKYKKLHYQGCCLICGKNIWRELRTVRYKYCSYNCKAKSMSNKRSLNWKGGKLVDFHGYVLLYKPKHPNSGISGYVLEHRYIMAKHLKRPLDPSELVHHINNNRTDNRLVNLVIMSISEHLSFHKKGRQFSPEHRRKLSLYAKTHPSPRNKTTGQYERISL